MTPNEEYMKDIRALIAKKYITIRECESDIKILNARLNNIKEHGKNIDSVFGWLTDKDIEEIIKRWEELDANI